MTLRSLMPRARRALMESLPMTSSMLERVIRAKVAMGMVHRHRQGRIMWEITSHRPLARSPRPITGKIARFTEKKLTSIIPSQKMGMDTPTRASTINT